MGGATVSETHAVLTVVERELMLYAAGEKLHYIVDYIFSIDSEMMVEVGAVPLRHAYSKSGRTYAMSSLNIVFLAYNFSIMNETPKLSRSLNICPLPQTKL